MLRVHKDIRIFLKISAYYVPAVHFHVISVVPAFGNERVQVAVADKPEPALLLDHLEAALKTLCETSVRVENICTKLARYLYDDDIAFRFDRRHDSSRREPAGIDSLVAEDLLEVRVQKLIVVARLFCKGVKSGFKTCNCTFCHNSFS